MIDSKVIADRSKASQGHSELRWLLTKIAEIEPKVIVEIGVHQGYSMQTWMEAFPDAYVIGVDNDLYDLKIPMEGKHHIILEANSHDMETGPRVVEFLNGREADFLFIDGDHMYEGVKKDFEMYGPLVREGGIIAFDDMFLFDNPSVEVYKLWKEITDLKRHKWAFKQDDSNGIGVLYV